MAITLTDVQLAQELRIVAGDATAIPDASQASVIGRLLGASSAMVMEYLGAGFEDTPDDVVNEAVARAAGFLYDSPPAASRRFSAVLQQSGAMSILSMFRPVRALSLGDVAQSVSSMTGVDRATVEAIIGELVEAWALTDDDTLIPAEKLAMPRKTYPRLGTQDVTAEPPTGAVVGDVILGLANGRLYVYQVISTTGSPYLNLLGSTS